MAQYSVITSKAAERDYRDIMDRHADLVKGMTVQASKIDQVRTQKAADLASQNAMNMEMEREKMASDTTAKKNDLDFAIKQGDLDIRRAQLSLD